MDLSALATDRVPSNGSDESTRRVVTAVSRLLARGRPVAPRRAAAHAGTSVAEVEKVLEGWGGTRRDEAGRIVAFGGLDLDTTPHAMTVNGTRLHTWCAWDTFFVPLVLGTDATVESRSPGGETVSLVVGPGGVRDVTPGTAVLSLVQPPEGCCRDVRARFCSRVLLFPDAAAGDRWVDGRDDITLVSLDEAVRTGREHAQAVAGGLGAAPGTTSTQLLTMSVRPDPTADLAAPAHAEGQPVGRGSGVVGGPVFDGTLRWALTERVGDDVCAMNLFAVIDTTDGATVDVEGQGFARLRDPSSARWEVSGALRLTSDDPRYDWLDEQLVSWDGEADLSTGTAAWGGWLRF